MDAILTFLIERWPIIIVVIIAVLLTALVCKFYYSRFVPTEKKADGADSKLKELDAVTRKVTGLPCTKHEDLLDRLTKNYDELRMLFMAVNTNIISLYSNKNRPRVLNMEGMWLFDAISGRDLLEENKDYLIGEIEKDNPKTALDVEFSALHVMYANLDKDFFNNVKIWVYDCPTKKYIIEGRERDYNIDMGDICFVLSIPLRDMYLERHPELKQ